MNNTRRNFLHTSLLLGAGSALLSACGDDDTPAVDAGGGGMDAGNMDTGGGLPTDAGGTDAGGTDAGGTDAGGTDAGPVETDAGPVETDAGPSPSCERTTSTIGSNHGHMLVVPAADVAAGADVTYDIQGTSGHTHSVTVTAADFTALADGPVTIASSDAGHTHSVMIACAAT